MGRQVVACGVSEQAREQGWEGGQATWEPSTRICGDSMIKPLLHAPVTLTTKLTARPTPIGE